MYLPPKRENEKEQTNERERETTKRKRAERDCPIEGASVRQETFRRTPLTPPPSGKMAVLVIHGPTDVKNYKCEMKRERLGRRRKRKRYVDETVVSRRERTDKGSAPRQEKGTGEDTRDASRLESAETNKTFVNRRQETEIREGI